MKSDGLDVCNVEPLDQIDMQKRTGWCLPSIPGITHAPQRVLTVHMVVWDDFRWPVHEQKIVDYTPTSYWQVVACRGEAGRREAGVGEVGRGVLPTTRPRNWWCRVG